MPSKRSSKTKQVKSADKSVFPYFSLLGALLVLIAIFIPLNIFSPVIKAELSYQFHKTNSELVKEAEITPVNTEFSIIIPKINANAKVIKNVNPFDSQIYQKALTQGVAHASNSATPDTSGNIFIFAHSAGNWYQANQYNAVFYLLNKLSSNDQIFLYYQNKKYTYLVKELKFVSATDTTFMNNNFTQHQLTLMTCWPPGTTLKRLVVISELQNVD